MRELKMDSELVELTSIYVARGLDEPLARLVAQKLMESDALGAHARDEHGISETMPTRPIQATIASVISFGVGAIIPFAAALLAPPDRVAEVTSATAPVALVFLGGTEVYAGGAPVA